MSTLPAWQKGYELERLRACAAPFKAMHKPLVFGGFGLVKENSVAAALEKGRFVEVGGASMHDVRGGAIVLETERSSEFVDFRGMRRNLFQRSLQVKHFAATSQIAAAELVDKLLALASGRQVYATLFAEDKVAVDAFRAANFKWLGTRIGAGSEIYVLYCNDRLLVNDYDLEREEQAVLEVLDEQLVPANRRLRILSEIERAAMPWEQHYSSYNKRKSWTSFALRGYSDDPSFIIKPAEMAKSWQEEHPAAMEEKPRWTRAAEQFPETMALVGEICDSIGRAAQTLDRVRFMRLAAAGELSRHADITDRDAGVADNKLTRLHIPIVTNPAVRMIGWGVHGQRREVFFPGGALCYLDQRKPHSVINPAGVERIHIVLDVRGSPRLREKIREACRGE